MDQKQGTLDRDKSAPGPVLYVAFELANSTWKLACSDGNKLRQRREALCFPALRVPANN